MAMGDADAVAVDAAPPDAEGPSKKALKKAAQAAEKARIKAERAAALEAKMAALSAAPDALEHAYGDAEMVQSKEITGRRWTRVDALDGALKGEEVLLRGRIHNVRGKGKSAFIVLRQQTATVQVTLFVDDVNVSKGMVKWASALTRESVVDVKGLVVHPEVPIESCTQKEIEIVCREIHCISRSDPELPFLIEDASRPDSAFEAEDTQFVRVLQDTRLNNRVMDLRTPANNAIFKIQSGGRDAVPRGVVAKKLYRDSHAQAHRGGVRRRRRRLQARLHATRPGVLGAVSAIIQANGHHG